MIVSAFKAGALAGGLVQAWTAFWMMTGALLETVIRVATTLATWFLLAHLVALLFGVGRDWWIARRRRRQQPENVWTMFRGTVLVACVMSGASACVPKHAPPLPQPVAPSPTAWSTRTPQTPQTSQTPAMPGVEPSSASPVPSNWWTLFGDAQLDALIDQALAANGNLHVALQRVEQSRAAWRAMRAQREPNVRFVSQTMAQRTAIQPLPAEIDVERINARLAAGADVAYEVDLWKRRALLTRAAAADVEAAMADAAAVRLMVSTEVVRQYVTLAQLARQQQMLEEARELAESRRAIVARQRGAGVATAELSLAIARELDALRASALEIEEQAQLARQQIAMLVGLPPVEHTFAPSATLWTLQPPHVPVGIPARVLAARPDVVSAETQVAAAGLRTRAAVRASFPELTLTGAFGLASDALKRFVTGSAIEWTAGAEVTAPLLARGRIRAGIEAAQAEEGVALAQYRVAVLTALGEVESALTRVGTTQRHESILRDIVSARRASHARTSARVAAGIDSRLDVLDAQAATLSALEALDRVRAERLLAAVDLARALGGGYAPPAPPADETIARYVAAIGGAAAVAKINTRVTSATMDLSGLKGTLETLQARPDRAAQYGVITSVGGFSMGYDGKTGWSMDPAEGHSELKDLALRHFVLEMRIDRDVRLPELYPTRTALPDRVLNGRTVHVIEMTPAHGLPEKWYFDAASGLVVQRDYSEDRGKLGRVAVTVVYADYRQVDGVGLPFRMDVREGRGDRFVVQVTSVRHNQPIDPSRFAPPAAK